MSGSSEWDEVGYVETVSAPWQFLVATAIAVCVALGAGAAGGWTANLTGYISGGLVAVLMICLYRREDARRRRDPRYAFVATWSRAATVLGLLAVVGAGWNAWGIATEVAS